MSRLPFPAYFLAHGGGPMPLLENAAWDNSMLVKAWKHNVESVLRVCGKPSAILIVSAHYQTQQPSVGSDPSPRMLYDYGGFPAEAYSVKYTAPGSPEIAQRALKLLAAAGFTAKEDPRRPYDHGVFVPLIKMFPDATIPVVPVSILQSEDPAQHIAMGRALAALRAEGVFIVGSGFSVHVLSGRVKGDGTRFNERLIEVLTADGLSRDERVAALQQFLKWPGAEEAQTKATGTDHFMPLLTTFGSGVDASAGGKAKVASRMKLPPMFGPGVDVVEFWFGEEHVLSQLDTAR